MSYFAKPYFINYDEWFDDDFKKKLDVKNKKIKTISNMHEFFYEQSNYKVGASENNLEFDFVMNQKELFSNNYPKKIPEKYPSLSSKNLWLFEKLLKSKPQFNMAKKIIYSLSIFGILFIFGFLILFVLQSKKNESNIINKSFIYEKKF